MLNQTARAHVVRTGRKIRQTEVAEIVSDCSTGSRDLFLPTRLKVDAQSEDLKTLDCFPVFIGDLPGDHSGRLKTESKILKLLAGFESDEFALIVLALLLRKFQKSFAPNRDPKGAGRKIGEHIRAIWATAHDALRTGRLHCVGIGRVEFNLSLGDGVAVIGAIDASRYLRQRQLGGLGIVFCLGHRQRGNGCVEPNTNNQVRGNTGGQPREPCVQN